MQNNNSKLNTVLLIVMIILLGVGIWMLYSKKEPKTDDSWKDYPLDTTPGFPCDEPGADCGGAQEPTGLNNTQTDQASWFIPNQLGWSEKTLTWKTYSQNGVSFNYPPNYVVEQKTEEGRQGIFLTYTIIRDPNSRSGSPDEIYMGVPYTGANEASAFYQISENVNNKGIDFSISHNASNYAKYVFSNIVASVR